MDTDITAIAVKSTIPLRIFMTIPGNRHMILSVENLQQGQAKIATDQSDTEELEISHQVRELDHGFEEKRFRGYTPLDGTGDDEK